MSGFVTPGLRSRVGDDPVDAYALLLPTLQQTRVQGGQQQRKSRPRQGAKYH
jgi:hypothetical protein